MSDFSANVGVVDYRERHRSQARQHYSGHFVAVFARHGAARRGKLAERALNALTVWKPLRAERRAGVHVTLGYPKPISSTIDSNACVNTLSRIAAAHHPMVQRQLGILSVPQGQRIKAGEQASFGRGSHNSRGSWWATMAA